MKVELIEKPYYVYGHYNTVGKLVYVGKGMYDRAWRTGNRGSKEHTDFLKYNLTKGNTDCVKLITTGMTEEDAFELEELLIKEANPVYNNTHTEEWYLRLREQSKKQAIRRCKPVTTSLGKFNSITEAANKHGIQRSTATKYLKEGKWQYGH